MSMGKDLKNECVKKLKIVVKEDLLIFLKIVKGW